MISQFVSGATREQSGAFDVTETSMQPAGAAPARRAQTKQFAVQTKHLGFPEEVTMKAFTIFAFAILSILLVSNTSNVTPCVSVQDGKKPPEVITLGADAKLGSIKFNHLDHITKNRSVDGTKPIACVECHHTAQPASEAVKHPPHKTAWPADRTTTLTAELLEKDANAVGAVCRDCHAKADTKPKLLPDIPQVKFEGSAEPTIMTNQQAFHRNCGGCHDAVVKARPDLTPPPPTSKKCVACHKKTAA